MIHPGMLCFLVVFLIFYCIAIVIITIPMLQSNNNICVIWGVVGLCTPLLFLYFGWGVHMRNIDYYLIYDDKPENIVSCWHTSKHYIQQYMKYMNICNNTITGENIPATVANNVAEDSVMKNEETTNNVYLPDSFESAKHQIKNCLEILQYSKKARRDMSEYLKTHADNPELKELKAALVNSDSTIK